MGKEFKKRWNDLTGRPASLGHDVLSYGTPASGLGGVIAYAELTDNGVAAWNVGRKARVDHVSVNLSAAPVLNSVAVAVFQGSTIVASGNFTPSTNKYRTWTFEAEKDNEVVVSSGTAIKATYAIGTDIGASRSLSVHVGLQYIEE